MLLVSAPAAAQTAPERPFGTLREQAGDAADWLQKRLDTFLPALMRKHGVDMWVVPMREYNEDPVFSVDHVARDVRRAPADDLRLLRHLRGLGRRACDRRASNGSRSAARRRAACSRRGARRRPPPATSAGAQQAELWGDEQWQVLKAVVEERKPQRDRHRPLDGVRVHRRPVERRAQRDVRGARRQVDGEVQGRRTACRSN